MSPAVIERLRPSVLAALAATFALVVVLPGLGSSDFVGDDEALDAGVVWTIHREGEWLFPEFNGEYLPPKPPLFYWLAAGIAGMRGRADEWSVRLPSALAAAGTVFLTVAGGARMVGNGGALVGGLALAVMPVFRDQARLGRADMTMTFLVTAALFLYFLRPSPLARLDRWLFWTLVGLAALAKGSAGVGLVAVVVLADAWRDRERARSLVDPAILAFFVVGAFWYALGAIHWGERFVVKHVLGENFRHFFGSLVVDEKPVRGLLHHLSHFVNVFTGTAPWGFLLPLALLEPAPAGARVAPLQRWLFAGFVFFTLATRKSPYYLMPIFPALGLLVGEWAWRRSDLAAEREGRNRRLAVASLAAVGAALVAGLAWLALGTPGLDAARGAELGGLVRSPLLWLGIAGAVVATGVAIGAAIGRRTGELIAAALVAGLLVAEVLNAIEAPLARAQSLRRFARIVAERAEPGTPLVFFRLPLPAIALYAERRIPTLAADAAPPAGRFTVIVPESLEGELPAAWRATSRVIAWERARVFTRREMWILLLEVDQDRAPGDPASRLPPGRAFRPPRRSGAVRSGRSATEWMLRAESDG